MGRVVGIGGAPGIDPPPPASVQPLVINTVLLAP